MNQKILERIKEGADLKQENQARHQVIILNQKHLRSFVSERKKRKKSKKKKIRKNKKQLKNKKKHKKSNQIRFEVILGKSNIAWDLPESMLGYV